MSNKNFYITTPIYYVNDKPHLGHAYTTIACDAMARFKRLDGYDVFFLTGTDEHGQKVQTASENADVETQAFTDNVSQNFRDLVELLGFTNDDFIRTTEDRHKTAAQALWKALEANGAIYLDKYSGWYAVRDEAYYTEDELHDGPDGEKIAPSGAECEWVEEESYFFNLSDWAEKLLAYYEDHPEFIQPESRRNEVISFVKGGLKDLSISRTRLHWGVPVPGNESHVMYVWIDALTNYLTGVGYPDVDSESFKKFWPADYHVVGKDILRFHAIYWPAFLMAADLPVPKTIYAHGWWTIEGEKMSKSLGNVISPHDLVDRYGVDQARYFVLREIPFGNDGNFAHEGAIKRINSDLANGIGNLSQRTLSMIYKNCDGKIPAPSSPLTDEDKALLQTAQTEMLASVRDAYDEFKINKALEIIMRVSADADSYVDLQAPWQLKKDDPERMKTVLYVLAETIRCIALMIQPITPAAAASILDQICVPDDKRGFDCLNADHALKSGVSIDKPVGVFPRIAVDENSAYKSRIGIIKPYKDQYMIAADKLWFFYALGAAILWGFGYALSQKLLHHYQMAPSVLIFTSSAIAAPVYLLLSISSGVFQPNMSMLANSLPALSIVLLIAFAIIGGNFLIYHSIAAKNASLAAFIEITYPLFTVLFAALLLKEVQVNIHTAAGSILIFAGVAIIFLKS